MSDLRNRIQTPLPSQYAPVSLRRREVEEDEDIVSSASVMRAQATLSTAEPRIVSRFSGSILRAAVLDYQRKIGNRAVSRLLYRSTEDVVEPSIENAIDRKRGGGEEMATDSRSRMETFFGADFSDVHMHTDKESDELNRSLNAKAFTVGKDIFFRQGEYNPVSSSGQELLAHELTHVVQQSGGIQAKLELSNPTGHLEVEAERIARLYGRFTSQGQSVNRDAAEDEEDSIHMVQQKDSSRTIQEDTGSPGNNE